MIIFEIFSVLTQYDHSLFVEQSTSRSLKKTYTLRNKSIFIFIVHEHMKSMSYIIPTYLPVHTCYQIDTYTYSTCI